MKKANLYGALSVVFLFALQCGKDFSPDAFLPLKVGQTGHYQGLIKSIHVSECQEIAGARRFTLQFFDSAGAVMSKEVYLQKDHQIFWESYQPAVPLLPAVWFDPPIPLAPFSDQPGETKSLQILEKHSNGDEVHVHVSYHIDDVGTMIVGSTTYQDCIKVRMDYSYLESTETPYLAGAHTIWFVKAVGMVRFSFPSGEGELLESYLNGPG